MLTPSVLLVGPSFSGGGAEGRFTNIAKHLFGGRNDVAVLTTGGSFKDVIPDEVIDLGWNGLFSYPKIVWRLVRQLKSKKYDAVMAFGLFPSVFSIIAFMITGGHTKLIINEITRPEMTAGSGRGKAYNFLRRILYARSTLITANSSDGLRETCKLADVPVEKGIRVVNVIDKNRIDKKAVVKLDVPIPQGKFVIFVARLIFMKRVDTVIEAFSVLAGQIDCDLVIIGDGEARDALEAQVECLSLQDRVQFTGRLENPFPLLTRATAFVLSSEYEGFSNSVLEAMFCDVPVITSFCSSDAREMCDQGAALGFEVGDVNQLAECIAAVVTDESLGQSLVNHAIIYRSQHALEQAIPFYEDLIRQVVR